MQKEFFAPFVSFADKCIFAIKQGAVTFIALLAG